MRKNADVAFCRTKGYYLLVSSVRCHSLFLQDNAKRDGKDGDKVFYSLCSTHSSFAARARARELFESEMSYQMRLRQQETVFNWLARMLRWQMYETYACIYKQHTRLHVSNKTTTTFHLSLYL